MIECRSPNGVFYYPDEMIRTLVDQSCPPIVTCPHGLPKSIMGNPVICPRCEAIRPVELQPKQITEQRDYGLLLGYPVREDSGLLKDLGKMRFGAW